MSLILLGMMAEVIGKALTEPYVKLSIETRLSGIKEKEVDLVANDCEGISHGDSYMMAAMFQSMGNDL